MNGNGALRSKQGCWTCRLRRKKCDERQNICSTCEQLKITCYGYGAKPEWMDGGAKEKAMVEQIKQIVKHTSRRKGRLNTALSRFQRKEEVPKLAPKPTNATIAPLPTGKSPESIDSSTPTASGSSPEHSNGATNGTSPNSATHESDAAAASWLPSTFSSEEAVLLMHFLDNVFPLQYPVYKPSVAEGGRGWIISLLLRTKPLYHASLALATFHRGAILLESYRGPCNAAVVVEQEKHLAICLKEFRDAIESVSQLVGGFNCPHNAMGLMACIVQLIYFEVFAGHDTWKVHLKAACTTFIRGYYTEIGEIGLIRGRDAIWDPDTELTQIGCQPNERKAIFRFMSGVVIWLDILSSTMMGSSPDTLEFHPQALSSESHIKLENIMGCHNWVAIQIARIAALHQHKLLHDHCPNTIDHEPEIQDIRAKLQRESTELCLSAMAINQSDPVRSFGPVSKPPSFITRMFAISAGIYLHLVVHGYESGSEVLPLMATEAMMVLRSQVPAEMMHTIIFPLYIVGSIATGDDQAFFRYVFTAMPVLDPSLEHRGKILPLLEKVWHRRQSSSTVLSWQESLSFSDQNLLLI
ncbi:related to C6 zink-finger protein PRO1A [Phialocephala subalpina]|uniref:Related to C6 zink-finger protein PRO1A n=1 Tax=Phialocephala subalpina TaxID=576137 RepID=A0A1L7WUX3_9HELO|nr:related to C6 zink-finger protein PRO1A [Phialocephala subalpina]